LTGAQVKTAANIREEYLPRVEGSLRKLLKSDIYKRVEGELGPITWAWVYDLPEIAAVLLAAMALGFDKELIEAAKQANPAAAVVELAEKEAASEELGHLPDGVEWDAIRLAMTIAWHFNERAFSLYSMSMNKLLSRGQAGDDHAFLKAVRIDPSVAGSGALEARIGQATIFKDEEFMKGYAAALKGPHKRRRLHRRLRWPDYLLREIGARSTASMDDLFDLVTGVLKQYSDRLSVKSLEKLFDDWKKESTT